LQWIAALEAQLSELRKQVLGGARSEQLDPAQRELALGIKEAKAAVVGLAERISYERSRSKPRPTHAEIFVALPTVKRIELLPQPVRQDPGLYERIGEERIFEVELVPARLIKRESVRPTFRHRLDRLPAGAPMPPLVVPGGYASAGLITSVVIGKYVDHLPLYRQEQMSARWGAKLSRQPMCSWVEMAALWLEPVYRHLHRQLVAGDYLQADETPVRCNDPGHERRGDPPVLHLGDHSPGRGRRLLVQETRAYDELGSLLGTFRGVLQSDQYGASVSHERRTEGITRVECRAHDRHKFNEAI
jgi:transposase